MRKEAQLNVLSAVKMVRKEGSWRRGTRFGDELVVSGSYPLYPLLLAPHSSHHPEAPFLPKLRAIQSFAQAYVSGSSWTPFPQSALILFGITKPVERLCIFSKCGC